MWDYDDAYIIDTTRYNYYPTTTTTGLDVSKNFRREPVLTDSDGNVKAGAYTSYNGNITTPTNPMVWDLLTTPGTST